MTKSQNILDQATDKIPGHREAQTRLDTAKNWQIPNPSESRETVAAHLYSEAAKGAPCPDDIAERIVRGTQAEGAYMEAHSMVKSLITQAEAELGEVLRSGAHDALGWLNEQMSALRSDVSEVVGKLDGVTSAEEAIAVGSTSVKAWAALDDLVTRYEQIRNAQMKLMRSLFDTLTWRGGVDGGAPVAQVLARSGHFVDAVDREPHWLGLRKEAARVTRLGETQNGLSPGQHPGLKEWLNWSDTAPGTPWDAIPLNGCWPTGDHKNFLIWAMTEARPWVPTVDQLMHADDLARTATRPVLYYGGERATPTNDQVAAHVKAVNEMHKTGATKDGIKSAVAA